MVTFSGHLGLWGSTLIFGNRVALNPELADGMRDVASAIISDEQTQSIRACCFQTKDLFSDYLSKEKPYWAYITCHMYSTLNKSSMYKSISILMFLQSMLCEKLGRNIHPVSVTWSLTHADVDSHVQLFPPCMGQLHRSLRQQHRLSHHARVRHTEELWMQSVFYLLLIDLISI